jgi:hypothetical protein
MIINTKNKSKNKRKKRKIVDSKLKWLSKPTKMVSTDKLDGRRKAGVDSGQFGNSKPILPLKPITQTQLSSEKDRLEEIKKRKMAEKLKKTARAKRKYKPVADSYKNNSVKNAKDKDNPVPTKG